MTKCQWFFLCENPAVGFTTHPILGRVAVCTRCSDRHSLPIIAPVSSD